MSPIDFFNSVYFDDDAEVSSSWKSYKHLSTLIKNDVIRIAKINEETEIDDLVEIYPFESILPGT